MAANIFHSVLPPAHVTALSKDANIGPLCFSPSHRKIKSNDGTSEKRTRGENNFEWIMNGQVPQLTFGGSVGWLGDSEKV